MAVFDIAAAERGGTLIYVDGAGTVFRWKIPASNSGPLAQEKGTHAYVFIPASRAHGQ